MEQLSIIIPTYNERNNIIPLINQIETVLDGLNFEILIIDDNSPDQTWDLIFDTYSKKENIRAFKRITSKGLVKSLEHGVKNSQGEILVFMDGDFSHPPKTIVDLISKLDSFDIAIASRYANGGVDGRDQVKFHRLLSKLISHIFKYSTGLPIRDITSGFFAIHKSKLKPLRGGYGEYFIDLISNLFHQGAKIVEVPYTNKNRKYGISKSGTNSLELIIRGIPYLLMIFKHSKFVRYILGSR
ncbi:MAG: hypothetical protein DRQ88_04405 [Epsilonproteobacteria bacterium]|nr:MAG: hypothetical protein DRQ89_10035 [Campylobacterota bacterium]RLA67000.1 MAG: hypothetical protein DRQ88_04405 [Campylobacterota bacterium]